MKFKFSKLQYQQDAINSIISVLEGSYTLNDNLGVANPKIYFSDNIINLILAQQKKHRLEHISTCEYDRSQALNLDIMMETGTGKTITFIETMYRLHQEYNLSKFIIVVPSTAIRLGTVKNINITQEYFKDYGVNISVFDSNNVAGFVGANNGKISCLITTFQAFNKSSNVIHKKILESTDIFNTDTGNTKSYVEQIKRQNPIVIIDEPHRAEGNKTQLKLQDFKPQLVLRFGATFNSYKNLIYALDSAAAFKNNLVKNINVRPTGANLNISLQYLGNCKISYCSDGETIIKTVTNKDNLADIFSDSGLSSYIVKIGNAKDPEKICFEGDYPSLHKNAEPLICDCLKADVTMAMLQEAVATHFEKEKFLFKFNIKVLSLFFIDHVASYYQDSNKDGELAKLFEKIYQEQLKQQLEDTSLSKEYRTYLQMFSQDISQVHNGYFAKSNSDKDNQAQIDLILKEKEKLLSFDTPLRFIFSKWALREGWDNPNIFVITKLSPSESTITKLQQIGRGLRLAVDSEGNRITAHHAQFELINVLDVIIPNAEKNFVESIQQEIDKNSTNNKIQSFSNQDLVNYGICLNQKDANDTIALLEKCKIIRADDDYNCHLVCNKEEFHKLCNLAKQHHREIPEPVQQFIIDIFTLRDKIKNTRNKIADIVNTRIKADKSAHFKAMWAYINSNATPLYDLNRSKLIDDIVDTINKTLIIHKPRLESYLIRNVQDRSKMSSNVASGLTASSNILPTYSSSILEHKISLFEFITQIVQKTKLTQDTIKQVLQKINPNKFQSLQNNYRASINEISKICNEVKHTIMIKSIKFDIIETKIKNTALTDINGNFYQQINAYNLGKELLSVPEELTQIVQDKSLFADYLAYDSEIEHLLIKNSYDQAIVVFTKLPKINIKTPAGYYNPDFAYVLQVSNRNVNNSNTEEIFLVIETKGYKNEAMTQRNISADEKDKIFCAERFFKDLQAKFPEIQVKYYQANESHKLENIIKEVLHEKVANEK
jgi:type III restriction enzyme